MSELLRKISVTPESVDSKLNNLEGQKNTTPFDYEVVTKGILKIKYEGEVLDLFIKKENLIGAMTRLNKILYDYKASGKKGDFYADESFLTKGDTNPMIFLRLSDSIFGDNEFFGDSDIMTDNEIYETFGIRPTRDNKVVNKIADFLNRVKDKIHVNQDNIKKLHMLLNI